jgi:hypothetical protein
MGDYHIKAVLASPKSRIAGGLIIKTGDNEFVVAGKGLDIFFTPKDTSMRNGIDVADEGIFSGGNWIAKRRLNGDETHASTYDGTGIRLPDQKAGVQKVSLYRYE